MFLLLLLLPFLYGLLLMWTVAHDDIINDFNNIFWIGIRKIDDCVSLAQEAALMTETRRGGLL